MKRQVHETEIVTSSVDRLAHGEVLTWRKSDFQVQILLAIQKLFTGKKHVFT